MNKPKLKISESAYEELLDILKKNPEYTHLKLKHLNKCCGTRIELVFDVDNEGLIEDTVESLKILYNHSFSEEIKEVIILFKDFNFMIKATPWNESKKKCSGKCCKH